MKKSFIRHIFAVSILSCCLLFGGCSQNSDGEETSSATTASTSPSETVAALPADVSPDSESSAIESTSEDTRALTLSVVNMCGIEVGMVAVIDPVTGEQVNLDSLSDQESISMEADWPPLSMSSNGLSTILTVNYALRGQPISAVPRPQ